MFFDHKMGYPVKERRHLLETLLATSEAVWEGMLHYHIAGQAVLVGLENFPYVREEKVTVIRGSVTAHVYFFHLDHPLFSSLQHCCCCC